MYRGQKAQDHENFEADTPMADNRRADYRRRARVDRTRDFYRGRANFWCASLRTGHLPDENIILKGHACSDEWIATVPETEYAAICNGLRALLG
jgi:hypothetical protein